MGAAGETGRPDRCPPGRALRSPMAGHWACDSILFARSIYRAGAQRGEKSAKSGRERVVTLGPGGVTMLEDWRLVCEARAQDVDAELVTDAFVASPMPDGSRPMNPDSFSSAIHRLCAPYNKVDNPKGLGIPHVHLHSLRHFAATLALQSGIDARNIAELLGHADGGVLVLDTYAHATSAVQRQAAAALDGFGKEESNPSRSDSLTDHAGSSAAATSPAQ